MQDHKRWTISTVGVSFLFFRDSTVDRPMYILLCIDIDLSSVSVVAEVWLVIEGPFAVGTD